ncbi:MAG: hypothetical protein HY331_11660 [Chloroflexi bacterium]|nr:hypothetical protein [Chloroflexota bacterium]
MGLVPVLLYFGLFCVLTYPLIFRFSTHFFADQGDGLQNIWNLWWVSKAIAELHQSPWQTSYLHYPRGISLLGHTLNPLNGLMAAPLLRLLSLTQAHNAIVVFSFVAGGLTAFLLSFHVSRSYWGSIVAGFVYTFSNYHFAHAEGHLNLVALEWIPLFVLFWRALLTRPRPLTGAAAGCALFAVVLTDYYYFVYCLLIAALMALWAAIGKRATLFVYLREQLAPLLAFGAVSALTVGPLVGSLILLNAQDPLVGGHPPRLYSLDALAPFIPGGHWRFATLTEAYWSKLPGNIHESSVHLGLSATGLLAYVWLRRRDLPARGIELWYVILASFTVLSLGPALHVWGREVSGIALPYALLEKAVPPLAVSGVPVRMAVVMTLSTAVIVGAGLPLVARRPAGKLVVSALLLVLFAEYLPRAIPTTRIPTPGYVEALRALPEAPVIDAVNPQTFAVYYQTIHEKPMAFGYVARRPTSAERRSYELRHLVQNREYGRLCRDYGFRYLIAPAGPDAAGDDAGMRLLYADAAARLYGLECVG